MQPADHFTDGVFRTGRSDVPWVVMRDGEPQLLESYFSCLMAGRGGSTFVTAIRPSLVTLMAMPEWNGERGLPVLISGSTARARSFVEHVVRSQSGKLKPIKGRPGFTVRVAKRKRRGLALLIIAMGAFVACMKEAGLFTGPNPMLIDGWEEMGEKDRVRLRAASPFQGRADAGHRCDVGRFFRFRFEVWIPVRTSDVRWFAKLMKLARAAAKYVAIELYLRMLGITGCRPGEPQWFTFGDWWCKQKGFGTLIRLRNKADDGEAEKDAVITRGFVDALVDYVDGERARRDPGRTMAHWRNLGRRADGGDKAAKEEMCATPVLLNTKGRRLTYKLVWHHTDSLFERGQDNPMTLHYLRHEFVFVRMRQIDRIKDPALKQAARDELCAYMGWRSGQLMLECYDAYHRRTLVQLAYVAFGELREAAIARGEEPSEQDLEELATLSPMLVCLMEAAA